MLAMGTAEISFAVTARPISSHVAHAMPAARNPKAKISLAVGTGIPIRAFAARLVAGQPTRAVAVAIKAVTRV